MIIRETYKQGATWKVRILGHFQPNDPASFSASRRANSMVFICCMRSNAVRSPVLCCRAPGFNHPVQFLYKGGNCRICENAFEEAARFPSPGAQVSGKISTHIDSGIVVRGLGTAPALLQFSTRPECAPPAGN